MSQWKWANEILYSMCRADPAHKEIDVIIGKVCLIGRATAASIERRKEEFVVENEDFYLESVAPKIKASDIDKWINGAAKIRYLSKSNMAAALRAHSQLTKLFSEISGQDKVSLASKYLHFHLPNAFFILDAIAEKELRKRLTRRINIREIEQYGININEINDRYARYVLRCLEYRDLMSKNMENRWITPRELDDMLFDRFIDHRLIGEEDSKKISRVAINKCIPRG